MPDQVDPHSATHARNSAICLIIPPSPFLLDERVFVSLGILKVAAACESQGVHVEVLDLSGIDNFLDVLAAHLRDSNIHNFGLTTTTPQMPAAAQITAQIRSRLPESKIILGGPHPTLVHAAARRERKLKRPGRGVAALEQLFGLADVVVAGDGEDAIMAALSSTAPRLIDADDPQSELFLTNERLTASPWAARHLVDITGYRYEIEGLPATSVIAQLGCPFNCGFCGGRASPMLRRVRLRSSDSVVNELEHLYHTYGFRGFMFYDDELNVNKRMVETMRDIRNLQERLGVSFRLRGFIKSELFNAQQAEAMYAAGFRWLLVGFESGSARILDNINKKATREDNSRCLRTAHDHGLKVKALMSVGHPGESRQSIDDTRDWLLESAPDEFDLTIITTYPGTPYFDQAEPCSHQERLWVYTCPRSGDRLYADELDYLQTSDYYKGDPDGGYRSYVHTDYLSRGELVALREQVESDVRNQLDIPYPTSTAKLAYEHSMGQGGALPATVLRRSPRQRVA